MMFDCVNSPRYSGSTSLVPTASLVDDALDIIVVEYAGWWRLLGHLAASLADKLPQRPGVTTFQAKEIILDSVKPPIAQIDGDPFTVKTSMKIEAVPDAIRVIAPPSFTQKQSA
jgi:diacylglycerol kinase family enzyme